MLQWSVGIDVGSTTVKVVVMEGDELRFQRYERHLSEVREKTVEILRQAREVLAGHAFRVALSGSAGLGLAKAAGIAFVQEVFATGKAVSKMEEPVDAVIELGGEDAKILFFTGGVEERMNGTCAGGTGAFIDQMATLLNVTVDELDELALKSTKKYPIASRCGVFAKSDIQPLLNQNADHADIAASIFQAVVDQTITGLAQGRRIEGRVAFLGGPLYFFKALQNAFRETLNLDEEHAIFPALGQYSVAIGAAVFASENAEETEFFALVNALEAAQESGERSGLLEPLFENKAEYEAFCARHDNTVPQEDLAGYTGDAYLGIDCGSTTTKLVLIGSDGQLLYQYYGSNLGDPVSVVREELIRIRSGCGERVKIRASVATGYGEELMKNAFHLDAGIVETIAHFTATKRFCPEVDFILDIGGQDIKCFRVRNNSIDSIALNEACSSGCGSFLETFAKALGYSIDEFSKLGLFAEHPVDLGSRCTVFMNSSVKQAQKEGASVADISAGLSVSVVKNALYKVIRARSAEELGEHIVVQGGTFHNDAVLRSFERELGRNVIRPGIAGVMGAYGAALYGMNLAKPVSDLVGLRELEQFSHSSAMSRCGLCANKCQLTIHTFADGRKFISGNKCQRPVKGTAGDEIPNLYEYKRTRILALPQGEGKRGTVGIPLGLNVFETVPFWHAFFTKLEIGVKLSPMASVELYNKGRYSIPSDTACYPAKLMHGHLEWLMDAGVDTIFYPCMTYNFDEGQSDNHFNCPVVAYYPELLRANVTRLEDVRFLYPHLGLHQPKYFPKKIYSMLKEVFPSLTLREVKDAAKAGYAAHAAWQQELEREGARAIQYARQNGRQIIVLAGRPYHIDPEINHGIDRLLSSLDLVVVSEDALPPEGGKLPVDVLNQWTYHARLYRAARWCVNNPDAELIQLVSFGCGLDAVTTDEVRDILERAGKLYTQIKIDEIANLGPARIRIRSLLGAVEERRRMSREEAMV